MVHMERLVAGGVRPAEIGVITPYNAQVGRRGRGLRRASVRLLVLEHAVARLLLCPP